MKLTKYILAFYFLIRMSGSFGPPIIEIIGPFNTQTTCQKWASSEEFKKVIITVDGEICYEGRRED